MMTDKLKPCPFCGGEAEPQYGSEEACQIGCVRGCTYTMWWDTKDQAIKAWNTRADDWQPIETAPKDEWILIATPQHDAGMTCSMWDSEVEWWMIDDGKNPELWLRGDAPTHWMPRPEPPKENEK